MNSDSRFWKWGLIVVLTGLACLALYPPGDKLKPGIDLAGGTSLIYEIDASGLKSREKSDLANRVMDILKTRVDPNSQFNLIWRPIGNNQLEIQMPRPPKGAGERRDVYEKARDSVKAKNISRVELESALNQTGSGREGALAALVRDVEGREEKLSAVAAAWDKYRSLRGGDNFEAEVNAQVAYEDAFDKVMASNLAIGRLTDALALKGNERAKEIERLEGEYPSYVDEIENTAAAHKVWFNKRGSLEDPEDLKRLLRGAGVLEFRVLAERDPGEPTMLKHDKEPSLRQPIAKYVDQLNKRGPRAKGGDLYEWYPIENVVSFLLQSARGGTVEEAEQMIESGRGSVVVSKYAGKYYVLTHVDEGDEKFGLTQQSPRWALKGAMISNDYRTGRPSVDFRLDPRGGAQFAKVTRLNLHRQLAIFLDGVATSHATIQSEISDRGQITGDFTLERVQDIVKRLEAGSLPARLKETPLQEKNTGPQLGEQNRTMGMNAALYGLIAVGVFMLVYYLFAGFLANVALVLNLLFVLAIMAGLEATFTLQGIAGLILTVGMAVDANVLIFERIREERERGVALRKSVKIGYEKALSTIVDANLTTLITCVILGYVGSEEVKGFALTLGFGLVTSMFTALFVTRVIMDTLIDAGWVKSLTMLHLIRRPNVDWFGLRRMFWPISTIAVVCGLGFFVYICGTDKEKIFDIEFLGGTSVQIELADGVEMNSAEVRDVLHGSGEGANVVDWLSQAAADLSEAKVSVSPNNIPGEFVVSSDKLDPAEIDVLLRTTFESSLALGGFTSEGSNAFFVTKSREVKVGDGENAGSVADEYLTLDDFKKGVESAAVYVKESVERLKGARVQTVFDLNAKTDEERAFEIVTVEPNKQLVRTAILGIMGDKLKIERPIGFTLMTDEVRAPDGMYPISEKDNLLGDVIGDHSPLNVREFKGGVVLVFDDLQPPQTEEEIKRRFKEMRLQPQFEQYESRETQVVPMNQVEVEGAEEGELYYSKFALLVSDESYIYDDDPAQWRLKLAEPELEQATEALSAEKSMRKVIQFAPQIASKTQQQALIAMVLALSAIVAYVWIRFGTMQYGLAAIVALVHDVSIVLGLITAADYFGIGDFRIDLATIAALLTVVGYSLNDTIVVFDRIRENRGKLSQLSTNIVNNSINMTLSRTLLTSLTTFMVVMFLYFFGGPGVHGFSFALLGGVVVGTYSSIGIAAPLLQNRKLLHMIIYILVAVLAVSISATVVGNLTFTVVVAALMFVLVVACSVIERKLDESPSRA